MTSTTADVVVIGAGVSGLTCARDLQRAGFHAVVLEARDRIGGRLHTLKLPGESPVELGGQVVHGRGSAAWRMIEAEGLELATPQPASHFFFHIGDRCLSVQDFVAQGATPPWQLEQRLTRIDPGDRPVADVLSAAAQGTLDYHVACEWMIHRWSGHPSELSIRGVHEARSSRDGDDRQYILTAGFDRLPSALARELEPRLGARVSEISWSPGAVEVLSDTGDVSARAAVVTVPPTVVAAGGIEFRPGLPEDKMRAAKAIDLGDAVAVVATTAPAPWSACALGVGRYGGLWQSRRGSRLVTGMFRGAGARSARATGVEANLVTTLVEPIFPWVAAGGIVDLYVMDWGADPFTAGAFSYPRVGMLHMAQVWASPLADTMFFAGEATASKAGVGLVDGAIESGDRAARAAIRALRRPAAGRGAHAARPRGARRTARENAR